MIFSMYMQLIYSVYVLKILTVVDAPWNVIATSLSSSAIKLTWRPPKVRQSDQRVSKRPLNTE